MVSACEYPHPEEGFSTFRFDSTLGDERDIPGLLESYAALGLGRSILLKQHGSLNDRSSMEIGAYAIPASLQENEHLIILRSGRMLFVQPKDDKEDTKTTYTRFFTPNSFPFVWQLSDVHDEQGDEGLFYTMHPVFENGASRVVASNIHGPNDDFNQRVALAKTAAFELREQRIQGIESSRTALLREIQPEFTPTREESPPLTQAETITLFDDQICY